MKLSDPNNDNAINPLTQLIQVMQEDTLIHDKITHLLRMDSSQRCHVLNNWLEQLNKRHAPDNLLNALGFLFDDTIARQFLTFMNKHKR